MHIHTDKLTHSDIVDAVRGAGVEISPNVWTVRLTDAGVKHHGSRSRARAFRFQVQGTSSRAPGWNRSEHQGQKAATWDEWGMILAELFRRDPDAFVPDVYESGEHFRWVTGARFDTLTPANQHDGAGHKWSGAYPNITGVYYVAECTGRKGYHCTATVRHMAHGHTFAEISDPRDFDGMEGV